MHRLALAVALAITVVGASASADNQHQEGVYTGAKPGVRPGADVGKPQKKPPAGTLSWIGFEAKDRAATVWLQAANPFEISQRVEGATLVVEVTGLRRMVRNARRPIDTHYFDNPLARISAKAVGARHSKKVHRKAGLEIRIQFKNAKDAKEASTRTATEADGLFYTYLSFPPGTDVEGASTDTTVDRDAGIER